MQRRRTEPRSCARCSPPSRSSLALQTLLRFFRPPGRPLQLGTRAAELALLLEKQTSSSNSRLNGAQLFPWQQWHLLTDAISACRADSHAATGLISALHLKPQGSLSYRWPSPTCWTCLSSVRQSCKRSSGHHAWRSERLRTRNKASPPAATQQLQQVRSSLPSPLLPLCCLPTVTAALPAHCRCSTCSCASCYTCVAPLQLMRQSTRSLVSCLILQERGRGTLEAVRCWPA